MEAHENAILELKGVSKSFPGVRALDRASVAIRREEVHALLGENGAGKSTIVNLIAGVASPDEGQIVLDREQVEFRNPRDSIQAGIGVIYQELMLVHELSVAENIFLGRLPRRRGAMVNWAELRRRARAILGRLGVDVDPSVAVSSLSTGAQQQVEIARALALAPKILVMDEPTSALTEHEVERLFEVIGKLKEDGLTVIFISHRLEEVWGIADRVTILRDGKVVLTQPTGELTRAGLAEAMVGHELRGGDDRPPSIGEPALRVRNLSNHRLRDISLEIRRGEIVGIAGALGSGRTELLRAIYGLDPIDAGQIVVNQTHVAITSPRAAIRYRIFLVPEDRKLEGLVLGMSVAENITLPYLDRLGRAGFVSRRTQAEIVDKLIERLRIRTPHRGQRVAYLSGGNQQKAVLARWLALKPRILLLDQPTRGLDIGAKEEVYEIIRELTEQGVAVVFVATELPELLELCHRIYVLREGQVVREFDAGKCSEKDVFLAAVGEAE